MRSMRSIGIPLLLVSLLLATWPALSVCAALPDKEVQLVYAISPWTGVEYGETYATENSDTVYLLPDVENVLKPVRTEVYFWEITGEYLVDWDSHKEDVQGSLEILHDGRVIRTLNKVDCSYLYYDGYYGDDTRLLTGIEAQAEYERYVAALNQYRDAVSSYYQAEAEFSAKIGELARRARETGEAVRPEEIPPTPTQPVMPGFLVTQPIKSFVLELSEGEYVIRVVDESGNIVPGSVRNLIVFGPRRQGVGYEMIPESKWTLPVISSDASETVYVQGETTVYLKLFDAKEFNTFKYIRMNQPHRPSAGRGTEDSWMWVNCRELNGVRVQILKDGKVLSEVEERPYYVKQSPGHARGYDIVEFDPTDPDMRDSQPSFTAFKFELDDCGPYRIQSVVGSAGSVIPGSVRNVSLLESTSSLWLFIPALFPLMVAIVVWAYRHDWRLKQERPRT